MKRIESLDCLRGLLAFSVMLYHYLSWSFGTLGAEYTLGKLGTYAVSTFYVLSGLSLTIVYANKLKGGAGVLSYAVKRIFRIFPLYWLAVTTSVVLAAVQAFFAGGGYSVDAVRLALNYSLLFGFVRPDAYMSTGAWSIGNEMVFYALFPFLLFLGVRRRIVFYLVAALVLLLYVYFAFVVLDPSRSLSEQWSTYITPLNQTFLFVSGMLIGLWVEPGKGRFAPVLSLLLIAGVFHLYPAAGDKIAIVTGYDRLAFTLLSVAFVAVLYSAKLSLSNVSGRVMKWLGETSYSIYLLHPLVATPLIYATSKMGIPVLTGYVLVCIPATLVASYWSYNVLEKPMMRKGSSLAAQLSVRVAPRAPSASGGRHPPGREDGFGSRSAGADGRRVRTT